MIDDTHDPARCSWVESANRPGCDFPIQNLPLCAFVPPGAPSARPGVAIGDFILDVREWLAGEALNSYCGLPAAERALLRVKWVKALEAGAPARNLVAQADCRFLLPARVGDYTDFYASIHHATNLGRLFRPDGEPLLANWRQFALLVLINAFVGGMVGIERTVVPLIGAEEFHLSSTTLIVWSRCSSSRSWL